MNDRAPHSTPSHGDLGYLRSQAPTLALKTEAGDGVWPHTLILPSPLADTRIFSFSCRRVRGTGVVC
jgi:hypothetical protein